MECTTDYSIFKDFSSNRELDQKHVNKLMVAINERNLLHVNPIIVDDQMRVVDGQHRLAAAKELGVPIYYITDHINRQDISILNSNQKNWTGMDYINFFTVEKNEAFIKLSSLINHYPDMAVSALLVLSSLGGRRNINDLKKGVLDVSNIEHCREVCEICMDLNRRYQKDFVFDSRFPLALSVALKAENFKLEILIEKISASPREWVPCHTKVQYLEMIEEIYNRNLSKNKIRLR
ncbi:MAG TPA: ParB N-terminal domain-containing protein [Bacteroidales bacterium]|nr:ParB N-terminal domain-containing protein [Bacteroidales bacterium]